MTDKQRDVFSTKGHHQEDTLGPSMALVFIKYSNCMIVTLFFNVDV